MPITLPNGVVVPNADGQERISATGVAEMRALGMSADSGLAVAKAQSDQAAAAADATSRARDQALEDLIAGIEARLAALEYDSGNRNITGLISGGATSGNLRLSRVGRTVTFSAEVLVLAREEEGYGLLLSMPLGFRPWSNLKTSADNRGNISSEPTAVNMNLDRSGGVGIVNSLRADGINFVVTYLTGDPVPSTPPGDPA